jgi:signal transduction histidine kinase
VGYRQQYSTRLIVMQQELTRAYRHYRREALAWAVVFVTIVPVLLFVVPDFRLFPYERHGELVIVHLLAELIAIGVSLLVAVMAWHTLDRERLASSNLVLFGFTVVAGLDLVHALTYDGMPEFVLEPSTPMAIVFWLAGRLAAVLVLAGIALDLQLSRSRAAWLLAAAALVCGVAASGPWLLDHLPTLFEPGKGVTSFKRALEYGLCGLYVAVAALLWRVAERRQQPWLLLLAAGSLISGVGEILFTSYITPSDVQNVVGHAFKIATFVLIYRGMYITALRSPYARLERVQARLVEQESILRAVVNSIPFEVWVRDSEGRVIIENPAVVAHWGRLLGTLDTDPELPAETRARWIAKRERAARGETLFEQIRHVVHGKPRDFQNVVAPVVSDGRIVGSVGLNIDITERVHAEQEIRRLNAELELRVELRTRELRLANRELEEFSASVSHDLQAPLRNIAGYSALLQEQSGAFGDEVRRAIATIGQETQRAQRLIRDLLKLARVGRTGLDRRAVDLSALVREIIASLKVQTQGRDVRWQVDALPVLPVDLGLFRQVFENLLGNALKFTSGRSPARIRISAASDASGNCVVCVEDNGAGFDSKQVGNLFRAFRRLHPETQFQGTGIGLANVRRIVEHHGGRVWAEGSPDRGARFYVSIPYHALDLAGTG